MVWYNIFRSIHTCKASWKAAEKSLLGKLRKKTGYTFANCKKALELHENDIEKAEKWLHDQAQELGWSKAMKLEGRPTAQGVIAIYVTPKNAAMLEVNCETDFVSRNKTFQSLAELAVTACFQFCEKNPSSSSWLQKSFLDTERLKDLKINDKSLADHLALVIGSVGENLSLRRAVCFQASNDLCLAGYTHPSTNSFSHSKIYSGRYGAIVAFKPGFSHTEALGRQLCQHIVGMNPKKIGIPGEDVPVPDPDDEQCMIHQEYLLDPTLTVGQILQDTKTDVIDFVRFECGEEASKSCEEGKLKIAETGS